MGIRNKIGKHYPSMSGTMARANLPAATTALAAYNVNNQLTSWNGTTLSYDLNGNMTSDGYDPLTGTRAISWHRSGQQTFQYDGTGRRSQNGAGVGFVYDGLNPVQEIVSGSPRANLLTGGLDEIFARTDTSGTSSFLTDALGSTLALADSTATVQTQYTFDPFGNHNVGRFEHECVPVHGAGERPIGNVLLSRQILQPDAAKIHQ